MKRIATVIFAMLLLALSVLAASADQEGNAHWCNIDKFGCYETAEDGSTYYIMFWSESARKYIMGNLDRSLYQCCRLLL